jgi:hypothetical protein
MGADGRRGALAQSEADPFRVFGEARPVDRGDPQHHAIALFALLMRLDEPCDADAIGRALQDRVVVEVRLDGAGRKAGRNRCAAKCDRKRHRPRSQPPSNGHRRSGEQGRDPPNRFALRREIDDDTGPERDRQPRHQPKSSHQVRFYHV